MDLGSLTILCIACYLLLLIGLGLYANRQRKSNSLKDFYLAGGSLGSFVLLFTLYATQYSANTMMVTPAEVVHQGMGMILILGYMTATVIFYLTFAPQLYKLSRKFEFITPGDYFDHRFNHRSLSLLANVILVIVSINFLLSQLMAMGHITNGVTHGQIPYWAGVLFLAFVVLIYETLGGMRAVAWTDVMQGIMLLGGLLGLFLIVMPSKQELTHISEWLIENEPSKIGLPTTSFQTYWVSTVLMIGLGAAVYPQVVQRIYAAKSVRSLKQSLSAMVFMPLATVLILFLLGLISIPYFAENPMVARDAALPEMLRHWGQGGGFTMALCIMVIVGLLAAIMSTADSVLLSLSSIIAKDIIGKSTSQHMESERLTALGKKISWIIMICMVAVALQPQITLWGLIELKMQILIQIAPLFLLGLYQPKISSRAMMIGLTVGFTIAVVMFLMDIKTLGGIHVGLIAFMINMVCCVLISHFQNEKLA